MADLPSLKARTVIRALMKDGFIFVRQKGSHRLYRKGSYQTTIPFHTRDLKKPTPRAIIHQAGYNVEEFLKLLKK